MSVTIRVADLETDRAKIIDVLRRFLTEQSDARRYDWLYLNGPHGRAQVWIATDDDTNEVVGVCSAFPRQCRLAGGEVQTWVLGDFCIDVNYRSLGPAVRLQRACIESVGAEGVSLWYDFPSSSMMAVYRRLGIEGFSEVVRLVKPVRTDRKIEQIVKSPTLARGLASAGNLMLRWSERGGKSAADLEVALHEGPCAEEFSELFRKHASLYGFCVERTAAYLNWRYRDNPLRTYSIVTARRKGNLEAYAVLTRTPEDAVLADIFGNDDPDVVGKLIYGVARIVREQGGNRLIAPVLAVHPWRRNLERFGFWARETSPFVVGSSTRSGDSVSPADLSWFLVHGDRDS